MEITPQQRILSACVGVLAVGVVVTPMDVVKTRVQAAQAEAVSAASSSRVGGSGGYQEPCDKCLQQGRTFTTSARAPSVAIAGYDATLNAAASVVTPRERPPALPSGTVAALHHIGRYEGPRGLYRGLDVSLIMAIPATVLYYTVYDDLLARLEKSGANNVVAPVTSGASARIIATLCLAPLELVRTRIQSEKSAVIEEVAVRPPGRGVKRARVLANFPLITVGKAVAKIFQEEGAAALWRGVGTTMWRDVPFSMVYWLGYENLKTGLGCGRRNSDSDRGARVEGAEISRPAEEKGAADFLLRSFTAGAVSGAVASLLTHPFDVVKTQQQVVLKTLNDGGCEHRPQLPRKKPGTFDVMRNIVESRGVAGLFTGALPRVGKVAPACAIMITSFEAGKRFFGEKNAIAATASAKGSQ